MRVSRVLGVIWGLILALISAGMVLWIAYRQFVSEEPSGFATWWAVVLLVAWSVGVYVGLCRVRGVPVTFLGFARPPKREGE